MTRISLLMAALAISSVALAQQEEVLPCKHNDEQLLRQLHHDDPILIEQMRAAEAELEEFTAAFQLSAADRDDPDYIIPVVFHIIHNNGPENISNDQVYDAVRVLNEDMRRLNDNWETVNDAFIDIVADTRIEFRLATRDPQGNCHSGITRTVSSLTNVGDQSMKDLIQWPRNKYLNVWVAASANGAAGYTYRPGSVTNFPTGDGIVLLHTYTGSIGTSSPYRSHTLTHEVGHWINLAHTWGNSNEPGVPENCNDDDNVNDTPNTIGWTACNVNGNTCGGGVDNVENYMEYSYCGKMFTLGQATRMTAALNSSISQRNQLWQQSNLVAAGVDGEAALCAATFTGNGGVICVGASVAFQDQSFHNVISRTWNFPGGEPSSSSLPNPVVTYTEPGTYPVTLTVSDGNNTLTTTTQDFVTVLPVPGHGAPFFEGFEELSSLNGDRWTVRDPNGGNGFVITNATGFSGDRCVRLTNNGNTFQQIDELVSTTYDMSEVQSITISFRYAFAKRTADNDDRLRVYVTPNCGGVWSLRKQLRGSTDLPTSNTTNSVFVPTDASQWGYAVVDNIPADYFLENFRFKFWFQSDGGNNLYIDDINLNGMPVGIGPIELSGSEGMMVLPNPVTDNASLILHMDASQRTKLVLHDVLGRELSVFYEEMLATGEHRIEIPVDGLRSGMYFVRLDREGTEEVVRFVVE